MNTLINRDPNKLILGKTVMIHAFKYNGWFYRTWKFPKFIYEDNDVIILDMSYSRVITGEENSKRCFTSITSKSSYWIFFKNEWFNMRISILENGIKKYINVASPYIYEELAIKYYDFDLDFKKHPKSEWREIDQKDFEENKIKYKYPQQLINIINDLENKIWKYIHTGYFDKYTNNEFIVNLEKIAKSFKLKRKTNKNFGKYYKRNKTWIMKN